MMGGLGAHEYMAPCPAGENDVALSASGYAANVEVASATPQPVEGLTGGSAEPVETPGATTIEAVSNMFGVAPGALIKAFPVIADERGPGPRPDPRRPPPERRQAPQRAGSGLPPGAGGRGEVAVRLAAGLHRPDRRERAGDRRRGAQGPRGARRGRERGRTSTSRASSPAATSTRSGRTSAPWRPGTPTRRGGDPDRAGDRGRATSSSSAPATPSRSARPISTRTARSS